MGQGDIDFAGSNQEVSILVTARQSVSLNIPARVCIIGVYLVCVWSGSWGCGVLSVWSGSWVFVVLFVQWELGCKRYRNVASCQVVVLSYVKALSLKLRITCM